jgi:hypothetical protein
MANLGTHFNEQLGAHGAGQHRGRKWSGRRSIGFALLCSATLWTLIFFATKALIG